MSISAVIVNLNEAEKLDNCLKSIQGITDEKIIIDLGSTDNTLEVVKRNEAKLFKHKPVTYVELIRNFTISKAAGDWVLILDPDEMISPTLAERLVEIVNQDKFNAVKIPRKNVFFGKWILHSNWWPDKHIRFFKKGKVLWDETIHSYPKVSGSILELESKEELAIIHFSYDSIKEFIRRQNRYSTIEAENLYKKGERFNFRKMLWKTLRQFLVRFVKHRGFLDGFYGFSLTFLMMVYELTIWIKIWEKEHKL